MGQSKDRTGSHPLQEELEEGRLHEGVDCGRSVSGVRARMRQSVCEPRDSYSSGTERQRGSGGSGGQKRKSVSRNFCS